MRPVLIAILLVGCGTAAAPDKAARPVASVSATPIASAAPARDAGAPAAPVPDEPALAWGTRPKQDGPLFPIIDGMCIHAEAWTIDNASFLTWGNPTEPNYSAGGAVNFYRFTDDGLDYDVTKSVDPKHLFGGSMSPKLIVGRWPGPLVLFDNPGMTRLGESTAEIWSHDVAGWKQVASHTEFDKQRTDTARSSYEAATLFQGHTVYARVDANPINPGPYPLHYKADPPLAGLGAFDHLAYPESVVLGATEDALYSVINENNAVSLREWKDGKVRNIPLPAGFYASNTTRFVSTKPLIVAAERKLAILRDGKLQIVEPKLPPATRLGSVAAAPNGDVWIGDAAHTSIFVAHPDGTIDTKPTPAPAVKRSNDLNGAHAAMNGGGIAGVELDDPYVIGQGSSLFHWENNAWKEVPLPPAPWSTNTYRVETIAMAAKGDLFVNAAYGVKEAGWTIGERNRAILRTKRPREVLRCNEPRPDKGGYDGGVGLMSFPPFADDTCTTPFVVILRTVYKVHDKEPYVAADPKGQFPSVRAALAASDLAAAELVEFTSGDQRYLGASVPTVAAGRTLLAHLKKKVVVMPGLKPELVCGTPPDVNRRLSPPASAEAGSTRH